MSDNHDPLLRGGADDDYDATTRYNPDDYSTTRYHPDDHSTTEYRQDEYATKEYRQDDYATQRMPRDRSGRSYRGGPVPASEYRSGNHRPGDDTSGPNRGWIVAAVAVLTLVVGAAFYQLTKDDSAPSAATTTAATIENTTLVTEAPGTNPAPTTAAPVPTNPVTTAAATEPPQTTATTTTTAPAESIYVAVSLSDWMSPFVTSTPVADYPGDGIYASVESSVSGDAIAFKLVQTFWGDDCVEHFNDPDACEFDSVWWDDDPTTSISVPVSPAVEVVASFDHPDGIVSYQIPMTELARLIAGQAPDASAPADLKFRGDLFRLRISGQAVTAIAALPLA